MPMLSGTWQGSWDLLSLSLSPHRPALLGPSPRLTTCTQHRPQLFLGQGSLSPHHASCRFSTEIGCFKSPGFAPTLWWIWHPLCNVQGQAALGRGREGQAGCTDGGKWGGPAPVHLGKGEQTFPPGRQDTVLHSKSSTPVAGRISSPRSLVGNSATWHQTPKFTPSPVQENESLLPPRQERTYQMPPNH